MPKEIQSRKWLITINNPSEKGMSHDRIRDELTRFPSVLYWCMSDEVGEEGTYHTHIFLACENAVRFSVLKNRFTGGHFDIAKGTSVQNRDYVFKEGKWSGNKKEGTNLKETHEERGEIPIERQGQRNDIQDLYAMIKEGISDFDLLEMNPEYMNKLDKIDRARQIIRNQKFQSEFRMLETVYIFGLSDSGKTRGVLEQYGYNKVYRVTDYLHPFDSYNGEDVIMFEEFRSSLKIQDMLNYLDGYPLYLPSRYANKVACYTKVYIVTNIALDEQYKTVQEEYKETWRAFLRRIHKIKEYAADGIWEYTDLREYEECKKIREIEEIFKNKEGQTN